MDNGTGLVPCTAEGETDLTVIIPVNKHRKVLDTCLDVPESSPDVRLPLTTVGISGKTVWLKLSDNHGGHIPFTAKILVDLSADRRGIHMSRIEQAVSALHNTEFSSPADYCKALGRIVLQKQKAAYLSIELSGQLPFIQESPVTRLRSIDTFEAGCRVEFRENNAGSAPTRTGISAAVYHLTACPCTLAYNEILSEGSNEPWPQATHSQRSKTKIVVSPPEDRHLPAYQDLTAILDHTLHLSKDLLKRPDESELVLKAHRHPQFAEDAVRQVAQYAGERFTGMLPPETEIEIQSTSLESIHIHDVECCLKTTLKEIRAATQSTRQEQLK